MPIYNYRRNDFEVSICILIGVVFIWGLKGVAEVVGEPVEDVRESKTSGALVALSDSKGTSCSAFDLNNENRDAICLLENGLFLSGRTPCRHCWQYVSTSLKHNDSRGCKSAKMAYTRRGSFTTFLPNRFTIISMSSIEMFILLYLQ